MRTFVECGHRGCEEMAAVWFEWGKVRKWLKVDLHGVKRIDMTALHTAGWTAVASPKGRSVTFRCPKHKEKRQCAI